MYSSSQDPFDDPFDYLYNDGFFDMDPQLQQVPSDSFHSAGLMDTDQMQQMDYGASDLYPNEFVPLNQQIQQASSDSVFAELMSSNQQMSQTSTNCSQETVVHSDVNLIVLYMSELLTSYVRNDPPLKRSEWKQALEHVRNGIAVAHARGELKFVSDFSTMLEEGLQFLAEKCDRLEQIVRTFLPREQNYISRDSPPHSPIAAPVRPLGTVARPPTHMKKHAAKMRQFHQGQYVLCDLCRRAIPRLRFANHLKHVHTQEFNKIAKYRCEYCKNAVFMRAGALNNHISTCQIRLIQERITMRMPPTEHLICHMCDLKCATLKELCLHAEEEHPGVQIISCSGCGQYFRHPEPLIVHWSVAEKQNPDSKCARNGQAYLLPRQKLLSQMIAKFKANGSDKDFFYIECLTQDVRCTMSCEFVAKNFKRLYNHVHQKHNKAVHNSLLFGCLGCGLRFKSEPALREHLMRSEIERIEGCNNAGVVFWNEELSSKDLRPREQIELAAKRVEERETAKAAEMLDMTTETIDTIDIKKTTTGKESTLEEEGEVLEEIVEEVEYSTPFSPYHEPIEEVEQGPIEEMPELFLSN